MTHHIPIIIGIAGGSASGKTTVTNKILGRLDRNKVIVIEHDSYYRDLSTFGGQLPSEINFDHPDALETSLLIRHLGQLRQGNSVELPTYDYATYRRLAATERVEARSVIIIDGILIFENKELRSTMDIKIYVDTDADERLLRRLRRDLLERHRPIESIIDQYVRTVKPMHLEFVEPSKRWADVIIPNGGENEVAIDMVVSKIKELIRGERDIG